MRRDLYEKTALFHRYGGDAPARRTLTIGCTAAVPAHDMPLCSQKNKKEGYP